MNKIVYITFFAYSILVFPAGGHIFGLVDLTPIILVFLAFMRCGFQKNSFYYFPVIFIIVSFFSVAVNILLGVGEWGILINFIRLVFIFSSVFIVGFSVKVVNHKYDRLLLFAYLGLYVSVLISMLLYWLEIEVSESQQRMWIEGINGGLLRAGGLVGSTASFGHQVALFYAMTLYFFSVTGKQNYYRFFLYLALVISFYCVVISSSRAAFLNIVVFSTLFLFFFGKSKNLIKYLVLIFSVVAVLILLSTFISSEVISYTLNRFFYSSNDITKFSSSRIVNWLEYIDVVGENIFFGLGYKKALDVLKMQVDNSFLSILVEMGALPMLAYLYIWLHPLILCFSRVRKGNARAFLISFVLANLLHSMTLDMYTLWLSFPVMMFVIAIFLNKCLYGFEQAPLHMGGRNNEKS